MFYLYVPNTTFCYFQVVQDDGQECEICYTGLTDSNIVYCRDRHSFCTECVNTTFRMCVIGQGKTEFKCPSPTGCEECFSIVTLAGILDAGLIETFMQMNVQKALQQEVIYV